LKRYRQIPLPTHNNSTPVTLGDILQNDSAKGILERVSAQADSIKDIVIVFIGADGIEWQATDSANILLMLEKIKLDIVMGIYDGL